MLTIPENIQSVFPKTKLSSLQAEVSVKEENPVLWQAINAATARLSLELSTPDIGQLPAIASARKAYKAAGKDPARYRLSAEALLRRVVKGKGLYQVNNLVDLLNLVSIESGFSIGGYDADKIQGNISLGIGKEAEPYEGIGRGSLNIHKLPVLRDELGAFGSPTSDSLRTSVTAETKRFLMVFFDFGSDGHLAESMDRARELLEKFGQ